MPPPPDPHPPPGEPAPHPPDAVDALLPVVYEELRAIAHRHMRRERPDHTLDTTALVHEAYLNLVRNDRIEWQGRAHFLSMAAIAMRRILVDYARRRTTDKRGGGDAMITLDDGQAAHPHRPEEFLELDDALTRLATVHERAANVVLYRFFGGLSHEEIAGVLAISVPTVHRDWRFARLWLSRELNREMHA